MSYIDHNIGKSYREMKSLRQQTWMEHLFIDVGNDLSDDIDVNFTTLSKIDIHTIKANPMKIGDAKPRV